MPDAPAVKSLTMLARATGLDPETLHSLIRQAAAETGLAVGPPVVIHNHTHYYLGSVRITANTGSNVTENQSPGATNITDNSSTEQSQVNKTLGSGKAHLQGGMAGTFSAATVTGAGQAALAAAVAELAALIRGAEAGNPGKRDAAAAAAEEAKAEAEKPAGQRDAGRMGRAWATVKEWVTGAIAAGVFVADAEEKARALLERIGGWFAR